MCYMLCKNSRWLSKKPPLKLSYHFFVNFAFVNTAIARGGFYCIVFLHTECHIMFNVCALVKLCPKIFARGGS